MVEFLISRELRTRWINVSPAVGSYGVSFESSFNISPAGITTATVTRCISCDQTGLCFTHLQPSQCFQSLIHVEYEAVLCSHRIDVVSFRNREH